MGEDDLRPPGHWRGHRTAVSSGKLVTRWGVGLGDPVPEHPPPSGGAGPGRAPPGAGRRRQLLFLPLEVTGERAGRGAALKLGGPVTQWHRGRARPDPKSHGILGATDPLRSPPAPVRQGVRSNTPASRGLLSAMRARRPGTDRSRGGPAPWGGARLGWGHGRETGGTSLRLSCPFCLTSLALSTPPLHPPARSGPSSAQLGPMLHPLCEAPRNPALPLASPAWLQPASSPGPGKPGRGPPRA